MIYKDRSCNDCIKKSVCYAAGNNIERAQTCNEYLNKDSVDISPVRVNQIIYISIDNETVAEYIVDSVNFDRTGNYITAHLNCSVNFDRTGSYITPHLNRPDRDYLQHFDLNDFGKVFFNTLYEAKTHLNSRKLDRKCKDCTYYCWDENLGLSCCSKGLEEENECLLNAHKYFDYHN